MRVTLRRGAFRLQLLRDTGRRLGSSDDGEIERQLGEGRYFLAVPATGTDSGRYVVQRAARVITRARISIYGRRTAAEAPGGSARIVVQLRPPVDGPVRLTLERFDPLGHSCRL